MYTHWCVAGNMTAWMLTVRGKSQVMSVGDKFKKGNDNRDVILDNSSHRREKGAKLLAGIHLGS